ncbi:MAG: aspartate aminotransferase family protein [Eubacteriaceae bacterium]|nr:aspartate aminotransferase family protein [Eubacteriaceae bacterium]
MKSQHIMERGSAVIMPTYARFPIVFDHGEGCELTDADGKTYLDFTAGIAVNCLGYHHPALTAALSDQAKKMLHVSNLYWHEPMVQAAEKLTRLSGLDQVFMCNSGAEANEAAMKLARIYAKHEKSSASVEIIAMDHSFHGRTYAAITATGQPKYQKDLDPLMPAIRHVPFNNIGALKKAVSSRTAAILLEPIQGEGGIHPADPDYLTAVRALCDTQNIVLIFDEVQCGIGRTGTFFAYQGYGLKPDIVCFAKGVAGGVPMGGIIASEQVSRYFVPGTHASTFGAGPLATAAANVVLDIVGDPKFLDEVKNKGDYLRERLLALKAKGDVITDVRGLGLMQGIELTCEAGPVVNRAMDNGLLLVGAGKNVIRFVPPLVISEADIDRGVAILEQSLG